jgi:hypothetical protein
LTASNCVLSIDMTARAVRVQGEQLGRNRRV